MRRRRPPATMQMIGWLLMLLPMLASSFAPVARQNCNLPPSSSDAPSHQRIFLDSSSSINHCNRPQYSAQLHPQLPSTKRQCMNLITLAAIKSPSSSATSSTTTAHDVSQMSISQLLQLLNDCNARYPPNATRSQLEELVTMHCCNNNDISSSISSSSEQQDQQSSEAEAEVEIEPIIVSSAAMAKEQDAKSSRHDDVVDAIVLDDYENQQQQTAAYYKQQDNATKDRYSNGRPRQERERYPHEHQSPQARADNTRRNRNKKKRRPNFNYYYDNVRQQQQQHHQQQYDNANRHRPQRSNTRRMNNYDLYAATNKSSPPREFDLTDDDDNKDETYDSGLQIFLNGFYLAGKTAVQLGLDAINPLSSDNDDEEGGQWWYDEEGGRNVLDVNILDYSPYYYNDDYTRDASSRRRRGRGRDGGRRQQGYSAAQNVQGQQQRRRNPHSDVGEAGKNRYYKTNDTAYENNGTIKGYSIEDQPSPTILPSTAASPINLSENKSQRRYEAGGDKVRSKYGLYHSNNDYGYGTQAGNQTAQGGQREQTRRHRKNRELQWKHRLRRKFDAALGLDVETSTSSSSQPQQSYRNNRRARTRAKANGDIVPPPPPSTALPRRRTKLSPTRSHLDEVPIWRQSGTIASLLLDAKNAKDDDGRYPSNRRTSLEVRIRYTLVLV